MGTNWLGAWNGYRRGIWKHPKRKRTLTGEWQYLGEDRFIIRLDKIDSITGSYKTIIAYGDTPEGDKWKLVREEVVNELG